MPRPVRSSYLTHFLHLSKALCSPASEPMFSAMTFPWRSLKKAFGVFLYRPPISYTLDIWVCILTSVEQQTSLVLNQIKNNKLTVNSAIHWTGRNGSIDVLSLNLSLEHNQAHFSLTGSSERATTKTCVRSSRTANNMQISLDFKPDIDRVKGMIWDRALSQTSSG